MLSIEFKFKDDEMICFAFNSLTLNLCHFSQNRQKNKVEGSQPTQLQLENDRYNGSHLTLGW